MESIHIRQRLRPIRYAFMIGPGDLAAARRAVALNTVLWGGRYNPIVPTEPLNECQGLIREFDSDALIDLTGGRLPSPVATTFEDRVIGDGALVQQDERTGTVSLGFGFDILPILQRINDEELRFSSEPSRAAVVDAAVEWSAYAAFVCGTFDDLPPTKADYRALYLRTLHAQEITIVPADGPAGLERMLPPLRLTGYGLRLLGGSANFSSHIVYVGDHRSFADLVEFWNIRATGRTVGFVPVEHYEAYEPLVQLIASAGRYAINARVQNEADVQRGPSITEAVFEQIVTWINSRGRSLSARTWRPRFGVSIERYVGDIRVAETEGQTSEEISLLQDGRMTPIKVTWPKYLDPDEVRRGDYRWAVELTMMGGYFDNEWLFRFPQGPAVEKVARRAVIGLPSDVRVGRNGLVLSQDGLGGNAHLSPVASKDVFHALFEQAGLVAEPSQPGRYAEQIIHKMGSLQFDCRIFKLRGVRDVLQRLSRGGTLTKGNMYQIVTSTTADGFGQNWRPDLYEDLIVRRGQGFRTPEFGDVFNVMLEKRVIRPGLTFRCPNCFAQDWYHVSEFDEEYSCRFCFTQQRVEFGARGEWQYKADGRFRIKDAALGSLAVIISMWRLGKQSGLGDGKYLSSVNVRSRTDEWQCEIDYAHLDIPVFRGSYDLVLGQAAGFTDFTEGEIDRTARVVEAFERRPYLAFSTLKEAFSRDEKRMLNSLVGRGHRVMAMTRLELDPYSLHDRFRDAPVSHPHDLASLAEATTKLNLGI